MRIRVRDLQLSPVPEAQLSEAAREAVALCGGTVTDLTIVLTDDARMAELNSRLLGRRGPTDVIAFEAEGGQAEVFVSVETAVRQASERGHDRDVELCFLVAHGALHACGHRDDAPQQRQAMLALQTEALRRIRVIPEDGQLEA